MRVLHVVTLVSPDGAFGGPVRVARNQAASLRELGHEVILAGGCSGFAHPPTQLDGTETRLFPTHRLVPRTGFAGMHSPGLLKWIIAHARDFDVAHVHLARDLVTLPAAVALRRRGVPVIAQTHGMIDPSDRRSAHVVDFLATRRVLSSAAQLFYLTDRERSDLLDVAAGASTRLSHLPNGVPLSSHQSTRQSREVLFMSRLHARKNPVDFATTAATLLPSHPEWRFTLVGPDEGEGAAVTDVIAADSTGRLTWEGALAPESTAERMAAASVYVLPSHDEPFPMAVLEAMAAGLPIVLTSTCGIADQLEDDGVALVTDGTPTDLVRAVRVLLEDDALRGAMGERARRVATDRFSMPRVAEQLVRTYEAAVAG